MEGFFDGKRNRAKSAIKTEQIDLTLKLSPCGQNAEEEGGKWVIKTKASSSISNRGAEKEGPFVLCLDDRSCSVPAEAQKKGLLMRFGDLQTMRRVRTGKRLLLQKRRRAAAAAAAEADRSLAVSPPSLAGAQPPLALSVDKLKTHANPSWGSWHDEEGVASSNIKTALHMQKMPVKPSDENPLKKLKQVNNPNGDKTVSMDIVRKMPSVITSGEGPTGKRVEGLLYKYSKGQVCIVCVCHGNFFSASEFVKHAGGKEVNDPMKHITVCSDSFYINGDYGTAFVTQPF